MRNIQLFFLATLLFIIACEPTLDIKEEAKLSPMEYQMQQAFSIWDTKVSQLPEPDKTAHSTWLNFGIRYHYAALKDVVKLENLEAAAGVKIFKSGPHSASDLNFNSKNSFGYYNDAFVKTSLKTFKKATTNKVLNAMAERVYNSQLKNLARVYYDAYTYLKNNPDIPTYPINQGNSQPLSVDDVKNTYLEMIKNKEDAGDFIQEVFRPYADEVGGNSDNWYIANVAAGFWVRRMIDGTDDEFFSFLETAMKQYDKEGINGSEK